MHIIACQTPSFIEHAYPNPNPTHNCQLTGQTCSYQLDTPTYVDKKSLTCPRMSGVSERLSKYSH